MPRHEYRTSTTEIVAETIARYLSREGFETSQHGCLCEENTRGLEGIVVIHPHVQEECVDLVKAAVTNHPDTQFYIIDFSNLGRFDLIGKHDNLVYWRKPAAGRELFREYFESLQNASED